MRNISNSISPSLFSLFTTGRGLLGIERNSELARLLMSNHMSEPAETLSNSSNKGLIDGQSL
jgi:hypothetical protein